MGSLLVCVFNVTATDLQHELACRSAWITFEAKSARAKAPVYMIATSLSRCISKLDVQPRESNRCASGLHRTKDSGIAGFRVSRRSACVEIEIVYPQQQEEIMQLKRIAYTLCLSAGTVLLAGNVGLGQMPGSQPQQQQPQPTMPGQQPNHADQPGRGTGRLSRNRTDRPGLRREGFREQGT